MTDSTSNLDASYQRAHYRVTAEPAFILRVGVASPALALLYKQEDVNSAAFITACNPHSNILETAVNHIRQQQLEAQLTQRSLRWFPASGEDPDGHWPAETSCLVLGMDFESACAMARHLEQNAFVYCKDDATPQLVWIVP
jgi:hypothetical protein